MGTSQRLLADDRNIAIKKADKESCVVVWDRSDYVMEADKQFNDKKVYKNISDSKDLIPNLTEKSNKIFESLRKFKKACHLENFIFCPQKMFNVPGRPFIFNYSTSTEKFSEFLDSHLQLIMRKGLSYIKDSGDFIRKIKRIGSVPKNVILVIADVVGLYPSITHVALKALKQALDKREQKKIPTEDLLNMAEFVLKSNFFEFNGNIK